MYIKMAKQKKKRRDVIIIHLLFQAQGRMSAGLAYINSIHGAASMAERCGAIESTWPSCYENFSISRTAKRRASSGSSMAASLTSNNQMRKA